MVLFCGLEEKQSLKLKKFIYLMQKLQIGVLL